MSALAIIPARGGSKGLPRKNLRQLAGKPLIVWSIEHALRSKAIDDATRPSFPSIRLSLSFHHLTDRSASDERNTETKHRRRLCRHGATLQRLGSAATVLPVLPPFGAGGASLCSRGMIAMGLATLQNLFHFLFFSSRQMRLSGDRTFVGDRAAG